MSPPFEIIDGKDAVSMRNIEQLKSHRGRTLHGIKITAGGAAIHGAAKKGIAAVDVPKALFYVSAPQAAVK